MIRIGLDFDGTVVSCRERHVFVLRTLARAFGVGVDHDAVWALKRAGLSTRAALDRLGGGAVTHDMVHAWAAQIESLQWLGFDRPLLKGDLVARLRRSDCTLHLVTARRNAAHLHMQLNSLAMVDWWDSVDVVGAENAAVAKAAALRHRQCDLYIGDTEVDLAATNQMGASFVAVASGMRTKEFLRGVGAYEVADDVNEYLNGQ